MSVIKKLQCQRCKAEWYPRTPDKPKHCPKCSSPYWDKPVRFEAISNAQKRRDRD